MKPFFSMLMFAAIATLPSISAAVPSHTFKTNSSRCMSHLNEMITNNALNVSAWSCSLRNENDMKTLISFISEHQDITDLTALLIGRDLSISPLSELPQLTSLFTYTESAGGAVPFAKNTNLKSLTLFGTLSDEDVEALATNTSLHYLRLINTQDNPITDKAAFALAKQSTLDYLILETPNKISDDGLLALSQNNYLTGLGLSRNILSDQVSLTLAEHPRLKSLEVSAFASKKGALAVAGNKHLTKLFITYDRVDDDFVVALSSNPNLTELQFNALGISDKGFVALSKMQALKSLNIIYNPANVSDEAMAALINNQSIKELTLSNFGSDKNRTALGPKSLAAFAQNTSLETLSISKYLNGDDIAASLAHHKALRDLELTSSLVSSNGAIALAATNIRHLDLSQNVIDDSGIMELAKNESIDRLFLSSNNLGSNSAKALAQNTNITYLQLAMNHIDDEGAKALAANMTLKFLGLYKNNSITASGLEALRSNPGYITLVLPEGV